MQSIISIKNAYKSFYDGNQSHAVLQNLSLNVAPNQSVAIIGRSGSGKTTLLNCLCGLVVPEQGQIVVHDHRLTTMSDSKLTVFRRSTIGYVFQDYHLIDSLSARENVEFMLGLNGLGPSLDAVNELASLLEIDHILNKYPYELSGGQRQRVGILRALAFEPPIILADEPTGNLDQQTGNAVAKVLLDMVEKKKKTLILVTHSNALANMAKFQYELKEGALHTVGAQ